jgi:AcrR family transcriptional regulator
MPTAKRARLSVDERREQLVSLGGEIFSERPYDEVSIDGIAAAAGISKGLLYHYFPSKRDFYVAVVRHAAQEMEDATLADPALPAEERLAVGLDQYLDYVEQHARGFAAVLGAGIGNDPEVTAVVEGVRGVMTDRILTALPAGADPGGDRTAAVRIAVRGWVGFAEAASLEWLERRDVSRAELHGLLTATLVAAVTVAARGRAGGTPTTPSEPRRAAAASTGRAWAAR